MLKILKKESLYNSIRIVYIITVIIYALARQNITALQPYLMSDLLNVAVIGIAGVLVCWDVFVFKNIWKTKYIWLLAAFAGFTVISSIVGFKYGYIENLKTLANIFIQFCLLYVVGLSKDRKGLEKEVGIIITAVSVAWAIAVCASLFMYFADITYTQNRYLWGETSEIVQGFVREHMGAVVMRLWGVFVDPNFASAVCIAIIALSFFVAVTTKNKILRAFHIVNIILQFLYIVLSNSRMGLLILCLAVFAGVWYYSFLYIKNKTWHIIAKELISVVLAVLCVGICYLSVQVTKTVLPYVRLGIEYIEEILEEKPTQIDEITSSDIEETTLYEASTEEATTEDPVSEEATSQEENTEGVTTEETTTEEKTIEKLDRQDVAVKSDVSNGRFGLWMEGISTVFRQNILFGVGPRNYHTVANEIDPEMRISSGYSIHNSFVELLMGNGIVGTLMLLLFLVFCAKDAVVVRYKNTRKAKSVGFLMISVLCLLACGMFIACLFYTLSGATIILFTALGYAVRLTSDIDGDEQ